MQVKGQDQILSHVNGQIRKSTLTVVADPSTDQLTYYMLKIFP